MKVIDTTVSLPRFLIEKLHLGPLPLYRLPHYSDSNIGDYSLLANIISENDKKFLWFKYKNREYGDFIIEAILPNIVRIEKSVYIKYNDKIKKAITEFEDKTNRTVVLRIVDKIIHFSD